MTHEINKLYGCLSYCRAVNGRRDCKNCGLDKETVDAALHSLREQTIKECEEKGWAYIVDATRAESWSREDYKKALPKPDITSDK